jgi:hypothetical protein
VRPRAFLAAATICGTLLLPATAQATTSGSVTPNPVAFGNVTIGATATQGITITNTGDVDATVAESLSQGVFGLTGTCSGVTLAAGASCEDSLSFNPSTAGTVTDTLSVVLTAADTTTATINVPISATGVYPPVRVLSTNLQPTTFYPLVRDGFRDFTAYSFTLNQPGSGTVRVVNRTGHVVRTFSFSSRSAWTVRWNGRNSSGQKVKTGYYRFRVSARAHGTRDRSGYRTVRVRTGYKISVTRGSQAKVGTRWKNRGWTPYIPGGNCNWGTLTGSQLLSTCLFARATVG